MHRGWSVDGTENIGLDDRGGRVQKQVAGFRTKRDAQAADGRNSSIKMLPVGPIVLLATSGNSIDDELLSDDVILVTEYHLTRSAPGWGRQDR